MKTKSNALDSDSSAKAARTASLGKPPRYHIGGEYYGWVVLARRSAGTRVTYTGRCCRCSTVREFHSLKHTICACRAERKRLAVHYDEIIAMAKNGAACRDIAKTLKANYNSVYQFCKANNIVCAKARKVNAARVESIKALFAEGLTMTQTATRLNLHLSSVSKFCKRHGVVFTPTKPRGHGRPRSLNETDAGRLWDMWTKGLKQFEIAEAFGCCSATAGKYLREFKILPNRQEFCTMNKTTGNPVTAELVPNRQALCATDKSTDDPVTVEPVLIDKRGLAVMLSMPQKWVENHSRDIVGAVRVGRSWRYNIDAVNQAIAAGGNILRKPKHDGA